jgi:hypothetical protein
MTTPRPVRSRRFEAFRRLLGAGVASVALLAAAGLHAGVPPCGNGIVDLGEDCDPPGSITCPPGSPAAAFLPCGGDCTCPAVTTTTTSTVTTTTVPPAQALDHFQCYELKPAFFPAANVTVQDQFGTLTESLRFPHRLCNPTRKNGEEISDPTDHLVGYGTKPSTFAKRTNVTLVDQFGTLVVDVTRPDILLVPTSKDGVAQTPPLDHFQCYKIKRARGAAKFTKRTVTIANQLESTTVTLVKPFRLCTPASKNNEDPTAPSHPDHLTCYKSRGPGLAQSTHSIANQFGTDEVKVIHRRELCVPSLKNPPATTTTTTTTVTVTTATTTSSTTVTTPTTGNPTTSTTTTTLYGSPARAFREPVRSLLD